MLALQGGFERHLQVLAALGIQGEAIRYADQLDACEGLILPGGESTTMTRLLLVENLWSSVYDFVREKPVFGTCAGAILLAQKVADPRVKPFGILAVEALRNAYGRQVNSFTTSLEIPSGQIHAFQAVFIRAPQLRILSAKVKILATENDRPVLVRQGKILAATFHPELTGNPAIHRYFIESVVVSSSKNREKVAANV